MDYDVVICGAGVGGLTLATALGQRGHRVLVLEKQRRFRMMHKGELIQPRSLHVLDSLGLLGPLSAGGALPVAALAVLGHDGAPLVSLDYGMIPGPYRHGMVQSYREMLTTIADSLGGAVTLWTGARADGLLRDDAGRICGVRVQRGGEQDTVTAALTVAADGHASRLRDAAGLAVPAHRYGHQLVGFELADAPALGNRMNAYLTRDGLRALFALPGGRARLYVQVPAGAFRDVGRAGAPRWADDLLRGMPALEPVAEPLRQGLDTVQVLSAYRFVAPRWALPGLALLGDAAHCVHPMVGQGMNAAIRDAWTLGAWLPGAREFEPARVDAALAGYERQRRPDLQFTARLSHNLATLLTGTSRVGSALRPSLLRRNQTNDRLRRQITENVAGLTARRFTVRDWLSASGLIHGSKTSANNARTEEVNR
ncbi:FAD-dependent monooxygenase [Actinoplanes sp. KI2]|uniref:FAD-dependent oxidoreductase n=1 Tax=Actinoplanes sp. KI2 TaxID=2983315 RepID=UPI0021D5F675|nr:NAD(P)/FAD-dependent oxidoreductase [Actinoplanes sp. KI2]MCU7728470.1 FAD-dependent monooxygenase [Actinoplanes sp. KI2]